MAAETTDIAIYDGPGGVVEVRLTGDTVWLNLNQIAELLYRDKSMISRHLSKIFREGELEKEATVAFYATVQNEGGRSISRQIADDRGIESLKVIPLEA